MFTERGSRYGAHRSSQPSLPSGVPHAVTLYGDALVNDVQLYPGDLVNFTEVIATNAGEATLEFANCVAG